MTIYTSDTDATVAIASYREPVIATPGSRRLLLQRVRTYLRDYRRSTGDGDPGIMEAISEINAWLKEFEG